MVVLTLHYTPGVTVAEVHELANGVYAIDNGKGRRWTLTRNAVIADIRNECGQRIDPNGTLGGKLLALVSARFPAV